MEAKTVGELKIDVTEVRVQMARANITQSRLAELAGIHKNTMTKVLQNQTADLETIAGIARGLNVALREVGELELSPIDLLKPVGFPSPQMVAPDAEKEPVI